MAILRKTEKILQQNLSQIRILRHIFRIKNLPENFVCHVLFSGTTLFTENSFQMKYVLDGGH